MENTDILTNALSAGLSAYQRVGTDWFSPFAGIEIVFVESNRVNGPRGEYYSYAVFLDGALVALGEEQGNYAGGIYAYAFGLACCSEIEKKYPLMGINADRLNSLPMDLRGFIMSLPADVFKHMKLKNDNSKFILNWNGFQRLY